MTVQFKGGGDQGFCDDKNNDFVTRAMKGGGGWSNLHDVIYERPLIKKICGAKLKMKIYFFKVLTYKFCLQI